MPSLPHLGPVSFTLVGHKEMSAKMRRIADAMPPRIDQAALAEGQAIMRESKERYAPEDSGDLIATGRVSKDRRFTRNNLHGVILSYGGGRVDYALEVHEHPSSLSPASWRGKKIRWTKPGTGPKYLSKPLYRARRGMAGRLSRELRV